MDAGTRFSRVRMTRTRHGHGTWKSVERLLIDSGAEESAGGNAGNRLIGIPFFLEGFPERFHVVVETQTVGKSLGDAISGDFVVFDPIRAGDQHRIAYAAG